MNTMSATIESKEEVVPVGQRNMSLLKKDLGELIAQAQDLRMKMHFVLERVDDNGDAVNPLRPNYSPLIEEIDDCRSMAETVSNILKDIEARLVV